MGSSKCKSMIPGFVWDDIIFSEKKGLLGDLVYLLTDQNHTPCQFQMEYEYEGLIFSFSTLPFPHLRALPTFSGPRLYLMVFIFNDRFPFFNDSFERKSIRVKKGGKHVFIRGLLIPHENSWFFFLWYQFFQLLFNLKSNYPSQLPSLPWVFKYNMVLRSIRVGLVEKTNEKEWRKRDK